MMKWVERVWPDLPWNICMQRQTSVRNDCAQNGWMDGSARFHRWNLMINGSMEATWLDLYWVGMNLQSGHRHYLLFEESDLSKPSSRTQEKSLKVEIS
jgi:hypothetical protein